MSWTTALLTNSAYGYPSRGNARRIPATHLVCIHVTDNPNKPPATALQERNYANRSGSTGPSAHDYVDQSGDGVHAVDPRRFAAWSNGGLSSPKVLVPGVQAIVDLKARGYNPNEAYYREVECCGNASYPITPAQVETLAALIAQDSIDTGIGISRAVVHMHSDLDSVSRASDPVPATQAEAFVAGVIARATQIKKALVEASMTWDQLLAALDAEYKTLVTERDTLVADNEALRATIAAMRAKAEQVEVLANEIVTAAAQA